MSRPETPFQINDSPPVAELLNKIWEKLNLMENNQEVMKDKLLLLDNENRKRVEDIEKLAKHCHMLETEDESHEEITVTSPHVFPQSSFPHHQTYLNTSPLTKHTREQIPVCSRITQDPENVTSPAKDIIRTIEPLKGRDDNGVEDFIKSIKKARLRCNQQNLLLDFIIAEKIVENAKRAIRFTPINSYEDLYEALRHNLGTNSSVDLARSRLENIKQQNT